MRKPKPDLASLVAERVQEILRSENSRVIDTPERAYAHFKQWEGKKREHFFCLYLDSRRTMLGDPYLVSIGIAGYALVHPREVFREAILRSASYVIMGHNHPSGNPTPSPEDEAFTRRLRQAGEIVGIEVKDHLVIGSSCFVSFQQSRPGVL